MRKKKLVAALLAASMVAGLVGCGGGSSDTGSTGSSDSSSSDASSDSDDSSSSADSGDGSVYYLSFKPEQAEQWEAIAAKYTEETGVPVKVVTAASGTYEQTLKSEIAKSDAPTLFQINGPIGYQNWKDYCLDLSGTDLYSWLSDKSLAVTDGDGVYGIPYVVEGYGIIYNEEIMEKYFALDGAKATSMDEINNFDKLKEVVEDMTAKKGDLGIDGVFGSTSFSPGEDWRWQTHLMNLPIYYEYKDAGVSDEEEITFSYNEQYKNIFDLYINNSCTEPSMLGSKTVQDSMSEFALGQVAMIQNGNWGWGQVGDVEGNVVKEDKVKFLPIYTGVSGEESQGLCVGTENFFAVNSEASEADQKATIAFIEWLFNSDEGKNAVTNDLGFIAPFTTFGDDEGPTDPLAKEITRYLNDTSLTSVSWNFTSFPSQTFKDDLGYALLDYATGQKEWDALVSETIEEWKTEKEAIAE
ncbi:MAG: ABC transporter substrate-binding protein [Lachnospiraceae bacterium]|nr:ABC transporter substrate-binding protein [Lachnospiraceae bacterium]